MVVSAVYVDTIKQSGTEFQIFSLFFRADVVNPG